MPGKAKAKSKSKEGEDSVREKKRQQKVNSPETSDHELSHELSQDSGSARDGDKVFKRDNARRRTSDCENATVLMELLQADLISDPTTPTSVENAMRCLERERVQLIELNSELENSWSHFKSLIVSQSVLNLCNYEVTIAPVMAIIELWRSINQKSEAGTDKKFKEHPAEASGGKHQNPAGFWCGGKHQILLTDPRDCRLAEELFIWMDEILRSRIDAAAEYDRCRPLYDALERLLKTAEMRCALMRSYLSDLRDSFPQELFGADASLQAEGYAWSDLAHPPAEPPLPPSASALRFSNPAILLHGSRGGRVMQLRSPPVELADRTWVAILCAGEAEGFFGLYVESCYVELCTDGASAAAKELGSADKAGHFSVRISVRRGAAEQVRAAPFPMARITMLFSFVSQNLAAAGSHGWHVAGAQGGHLRFLSVRHPSMTPAAGGKWWWLGVRLESPGMNWGRAS
jgi:hypothetical protein